MDGPTEFVIETTAVCKTYRSGLLRRKAFAALQNVSLSVAGGQVYGLLGPNGAGKTTLIKILLGIVRRTSGTATVLGRPAGSLAARRDVGYLPENHRIPRHLTARTALLYYGGLSGMSGADIRRRSDELLEMVGLKGRESERVSGYSKGMLQRLGLAQAMLHRPKLVVLDEPTDGVDPVGRREIRDVLRRLASDGHSVFLNSHLLQEIELVCDSIAILNKGRLIKTGTVRDLTAALADAPVQLQVTGNGDALRRIVSAMNGAKLVQVAPDAFEIDIKVSEQAVIDRLVDELREAGLSIWKLGRREQTLEDVFLSVVGAEAR